MRRWIVLVSVLLLFAACRDEPVGQKNMGNPTQLPDASSVDASNLIDGIAADSARRDQGLAGPDVSSDVSDMAMPDGLSGTVDHHRGRRSAAHE